MATRELVAELGIIVEHQRFAGRWVTESWRVIGVIAGPTPAPSWRRIAEGRGFVQYLACNLPLQLHRSDATSYRINLQDEMPKLYVSLRRVGDDAFPYQPFKITAAPDEAQHFSESGDDLVEAVAMPAELAARLADFVARYPIDEPFSKRQRTRWGDDGR